ncbi:class I SAM-dependent methyltransferase [Agitococcus lubricus]|uniref:Methyltransferase family protein n=1 Tax=Agitococcus lubricus TaxID=1077255 RepID=A0A2T5J311_9GAMM|nr:methyltransferase [Agitococcus lubricus]PTQ91019.1 methyltransferase family protein [Agitococcus lubricus]
MTQKLILDAATIKRWRQDIVFSEEVLGNTYQFHSTWGIFSPESVDEGSRLLLEHVEFKTNDDCLDVGCGYGVLGMVCAKKAPQGTSVLVDKDFVAVDYARKNCAGNQLHNTEVLLSNGFSAIGNRQFDIILSNLPAKVSKEQHYLYLYDALQHLKVGGRFYVVTINGLREFIARTFKEVFGNYHKLKQGKTYTVAMAEKLE